MLDIFRKIDKEILDSLAAFLDKTPTSIPPVILNYQPVASGPNTYWTARGESSPEKIVGHGNAVVDVAVQTAYPILIKMFSNSIDLEQFRNASILDNALHELGHIPADKKDENVRRRIGTTGDSAILEELKADSVDQKLLWINIQRGNAAKVDVFYQFMAKLGDVCDYLKNKSSEPGTSGERYFYDGVAIISQLLEHRIIIRDGNRYRVTDAERGVQKIAQLADEVLHFYTHGTPDEVQTFIRGLRAKTAEGDVQEFIKKIKF